MEFKIRPLKASEIEVRVQTVKEKGFSVLLYKNARADMNILDEIFGVTGWQRRHTVINNNLFCSILIWDSEKNQWIEKQDVGVPSYAEGEKGEASDSFKRAAFNVGIGRELYTAPFIWINAKNGEINKDAKGKCKLDFGVKLHVSRIETDDRKVITALEISDQNANVRFTLGNRRTSEKNKIQPNSSNNNDNKQILINELVQFQKIKNINPEIISKMIRENFNKDKTINLSEDELKYLLELLRKSYGEK